MKLQHASDLDGMRKYSSDEAHDGDLLSSTMRAMARKLTNSLSYKPDKQERICLGRECGRVGIATGNCQTS